MADKPGAKDAAIEKQREIQREQDRKDESKGKSGGSPQDKPVQTTSKSAGAAGGRDQPGSMPAQHVEKPGIEAELDLKPRFEAPGYKGSGKLQDFATIVTGGDSGIGRAVAVLFAREG